MLKKTNIDCPCSLSCLQKRYLAKLLRFVQMVRLLGLEPLGEGLQQGFVVFADEKDRGGVALTPLYLLIGCSGPLWLHPARCTMRASLPMLAGLLSVGAGDTAASVVGSHLGKHHWQGEQIQYEISSHIHLFFHQLFHFPSCKLLIISYIG